MIRPNSTTKLTNETARSSLAANLIWPAKESALKVLRTGLRADTRTVEVVLAEPSGISTGAGQWQRLSVDREPAGSPDGGAGTASSCSPSWRPRA